MGFLDRLLLGARGHTAPLQPVVRAVYGEPVAEREIEVEPVEQAPSRSARRRADAAASVDRIEAPPPDRPRGCGAPAAA